MTTRPTVSVADAAAVNEGNDPNTTVNLSFAVTLDAVSGKQITVPYTLGGTAAATDDYTEPNPLSVSYCRRFPQRQHRRPGQGRHA